MPFEAESTANHVVSGVIAELAGAFVWTPMDVVKQRLMVTTSARYRGTLHCLTTIARTEGVRGLLKGYTIGVAVYGPFAGVYFGCYEHMKVVMTNVLNGYKAGGSYNKDNLPFPAVMFCGAWAGTWSAFVTCPLDVIKTRYQVSEGESAFANSRQAAKQLLATEGVAGLFKGLTARVLWMAPGSAITIAAYEILKRFI